MIIFPGRQSGSCGIVRGIAVYTPNTLRNFNLTLDKRPAISYHKGRLHITYSDQSPQPVKLAEEEIVLK
ncbi:MAG: hypothetical protein ICV53_08570 [Flavisolibacter sp.]|nr:hypothetical protein [Flavisolibacter sp.]